jgi:hypothetical protein
MEDDLARTNASIDEQFPSRNGVRLEPRWYMYSFQQTDSQHLLAVVSASSFSAALTAHFCAGSKRRKISRASCRNDSESGVLKHYSKPEIMKTATTKTAWASRGPIGSVRLAIDMLNVIILLEEGNMMGGWAV